MVIFVTLGWLGGIYVRSVAVISVDRSDTPGRITPKKYSALL
ncbi:MAG TPA: hypothetical protein VGP70_22720 [Actinomadura sp.]|jgi:hypothetical protein|nr:hypothetical protein [Actinomadura sp.]